MSDEHKWRRKCFVICLLALFIGLIGIVLPEQEDIAFEYVVNNTDLYNNGRITGLNYTANDSAIQLFLIFHVVGTGASLVVDTNLSINGTVVEDRDYRTTAGLGVHEHFSMTAHIPKGANYSVTNSSNLETIEWREYPILSGKNGTLIINMTGGTGSQNLSQVLVQGNSAGNNNINMNENYIYNVSSIYEDHGNNITYTRWDASTPVIITRVSSSPYINFIEMYPNYTYFSKGMTIAGDVTMDNSHTNYTNTGKWLNFGYNSVSGLMEINTSSIFYYKENGNFIGFTGNGFAYSAYNDKPIRFGQASANTSQIAYNTTYGTTWRGTGTSANRLNITGFDKVNMYQELDMNLENITNAHDIYQEFSAINMTIDNNCEDSGAPPVAKNCPRTLQELRTNYSNVTIRHRLNPANENYGITLNTKADLSLDNASLTGWGTFIRAQNDDFYVGRFKPGYSEFIWRATNNDTVTFYNNVTVVKNETITGLAGSGNAYVCVDSTGKLYRGNPGC